MKTHELIEERGRLVHSMREIADNPKGKNGDLDKDQETKFERMKDDLGGLEKRIERQQMLDDAERRMEGQKLTGSGDVKLDDELRNFSLRAAIASMVPDLASKVDAGRERELSQEIARRTGTPFKGIAVPMQVFEKRVVTGSTGASVISTDHLAGQYIDMLRAKLVVSKLGARVLNGLVGDVSIPRLAGSATAGWVGDNAALSASDITLASVTMSPKHCGCLTEFSRNMLLQSSPDIEQLLRSDFAGTLAREIDRVAIVGGGADEPSGILSLGSNLDTSTSLSTPSWEGVLELIEAVELGDSVGTGFVTTPTGVKTLRSTVKFGTTDSQTIMDSPNMLAGYTCASSTLVPSDSTGNRIIFGNWSDLMLGYWSAFDLLVNPYETTAYSKGNVQVRGMLTMDVAVRHYESFAAALDL
jgi:HK97 family phage major capsid protein